METSRSGRAKINIVVSFGSQIITLICGLVVPRLMLGKFGSEVYGATSSIAQFLAYITLLEGGIGGVARAALYKPLANKDVKTISAIMTEIHSFFRVISSIFAVYVLVIACSFKLISNVEALDWFASFMLVIVISISTFGQYFIGISNSILLQAAQKVYITNLINLVGTVVNTIAIIVLVNSGCNIIVVKLASSIIFFMKPIVLWLYVRKCYQLRRVNKTNKQYLTQKWSGLGQHIAFFLHSNTDVVVLTCLANLKDVAVYSVYHMVIANIQNISASFVAGMEAVFGDMLAKGEQEQLHKTFGVYEMIISVVSVIAFSVTAVLIVPFIQIYTAEINDTNYIEPIFGLILTVSSLLYCLRMPYHSLVIAAGHFKQTRVAAYSEATINIGLSVLLVYHYGLIGVAVGTIIATAFRFIYYVIYLSRNIFNRKIYMFIMRIVINAFTFCVVLLLGNFVISAFKIVNYLDWIGCAVLVTIVSCMVTLGINAVFYHSYYKSILKKIVCKK